jgi:gliding motility-associated-like protein
MKSQPFLLTKTLVIKLLCLFVPFIVAGQGQVVLVTNPPNSLFVCGSDTLTVKVFNKSSNALANSVLMLEMSQGVSYILSSVVGSQELNILNLEQPSFTLPIVAPNDSVEIQIVVQANCGLIQKINQGFLFSYMVRFTNGPITESITSLQYRIETGLILVSAVSPSNLIGTYGDVKQRTITITNTRLGKIRNIYFRDSLNATSVSVSAFGLPDLNPSNQIYEINIGGTQISQFGNLDQWLDFNESIIITEEVRFDSCLEQTNQLASSISVAWGCTNDFCAIEQSNSTINVLSNLLSADVVVSGSALPLSNFCAETGTLQLVRVKNTGNAVAKNLSLVVSGIIGSFAFESQTVEIDTNNTGQWFKVPVLATFDTNFGCKPNLSDSIRVNVGDLQNGKEIQIRFMSYGCGRDTCSLIESFIKVNYTYLRECIQPPLASKNEVITQDSGKYFINFSSKYDFGRCIQNDEFIPIELKVHSDFIRLNQGTMVVQTDLPQTITLDTTICKPVITETGQVGSVEIFTNADSSTQARFLFSIPISLDSLTIRFCLDYKCPDSLFCNSQNGINNDTTVVQFVDAQGVAISCPNPCEKTINTRLSFIQNLGNNISCSIGTCKQFVLTVSDTCNTGSTGQEPGFPFLPPFLKYNYTVQRENYDLSDLNNDRIADSFNSQPSIGVATKRFTVGDTMLLHLEGTPAVPDSLVNKFGFGVFHETSTADFLLADGDSFSIQNYGRRFCSQENFKYLTGSIRVKRADGSVDNCVFNPPLVKDRQLLTLETINISPPQKLAIIGTMQSGFQVDFNLCGGPLAYGDSCFIDLRWQIKSNILPHNNDNQEIPRVINFRVSLDSLKKAITSAQSDTSRILQYTGFHLAHKPPANTIRACENSIVAMPWKYNLKLARSNFFPFEVRPLYRLLDYRFNLPSGVDLNQINLRYLLNDDSLPMIAPLVLPFTQLGKEVLLSFDTLYQTPIDEGYSFEIALNFNQSCSFLDAMPLEGILKRWSKPCFETNVIDTISFGQNLGFYSALPKLFVKFDGPLNVQSGSKLIKAPFDLYSGVPQTARNPWVQFVGLSGTFSNITLSDGTTPIAQSAQNFFQLSNIPASSIKKLLPIITKSSCSDLKIRMYYGWSCDPIMQHTEACAKDSVDLNVSTFDPELELEIIQQPLKVQLCDTTDWFEVQISNAEKGNAYLPYFQTKLPNGLEVLLGTSQITLPGTNNYVALTDPQTLPNNQFKWDLTNTPILPDGLNPIDSLPRNTIRIRFKAKTQCGFVAQAQPIYETSAQNVCGSPSNLLRKPGVGLQLDGLLQAYQAQIQANPLLGDSLSCNKIETIQIQGVLNGIAQPTDSFYIDIPQGFSYVPNSYTPIQNTPLGGVMLNGRLLTIPIQAGLAPDAQIRFSIQVQYDYPVSCTSPSLTVQTRQIAEAFCPTNGTNCTVYLATGEAIVPLPIQFEKFNLKDIKMNLNTSGQYTIEGFIQNLLNQVAETPGIQIILDLNDNGVPDATDSILLSSNQSGSTAALSQSLFSAQLPNLAPDLICKIIVIIDSSSACICGQEYVLLNVSEITTAPITICEPTAIPIGIPQSVAHTYSWTPPGLVACSTCSITMFSPPMGSQAGDTFILNLTDQSVFCQLKYTYQIDLITEPQITATSINICRGQEVTLSVTPNASATVIWSGPGIASPTAPEQVITPQNSATYQAVISVGSFCSSTQNIQINVNILDTTQLAADSICMGEVVLIAGDTVTQTGTYCIKLENINGCDSIVCKQVTVLSDEVVIVETICKGDSLELFGGFVSVAGQYCLNLVNANGCDSLHCVEVRIADKPVISGINTLQIELGQAIQLNAPPGFSLYQWSPPEGLSCTDCNNTTATPTDSTAIYTLEVTNGSGCTDTALYRIRVLPACNPNRLQIPNAFTPNGDGSNDQFSIPPQEGSEIILSMQIFNRWGQSIIQEGAGAPVWNGTISGAQAPVDTYIYHFVIGCPDGSTNTRIGEITLLR